MHLKMLIISAAAIFAILQFVVVIAGGTLYGRPPKVLWITLAFQYMVPLLAVVARKMSPMVPSEFGYYHDLEFLPVIVVAIWIPFCMIISIVPIGLIVRELWKRVIDRTNPMGVYERK